MPTYTASEWSRSASGTTRKFRNYVTYTWEPNYSATQSRLIITAAGIVKTSGNQTEIVSGSTSSVKIVCNGVTKTYSTTSRKELDSAAPQYWNLKGTAADYIFYINKTTAQRNITVTVSGGITKPSAWYGTSSGSFTVTQPSSIFYNVTYDANGGTGAPANQIKYNDTALTLSSAIPTKPKYDFLYWNGDDGNTYQPSSVLPASYNDDLALTAEWRESYIAPEFSQMIAYRVDNDATGSNPSVSNSSTRGFVKFILQRGSGYDLDSISVKFGNNTPQTVPSSQIVVGQTQTTVYAYSNVGDCPSTSTTSITATVYVTDRASVQNTVTNATYVSPEKILVDYAHDAIGFGCPATDSPSENGNFDCALDANFTGALLHNGVPIEGGGGTSDYRALTNKPKINSVELSGDKTLDNLGIQSKITSTNKLSTSLINGLSAVATSNSYNDLNDKPTIPSEVTESTVSGWGFTKNTGDYSKPSGGIPKTDLDSSVQTSLGKADTAVQSLNVKFIADTTGVKYSDISTYLYEYDDIIIEIHGARYRFYYKDVDKHYFTSASEVGVRYATVDTSDNWSVTSVITPTKTNTYSSTSTDVMTGVAVAQALDTVDVPTKTSDLVNDSGFMTESNVKFISDTTGVTYNDISTYLYQYDDIIIEINGNRYRFYYKDVDKHYFTSATEVGVAYATVDTSNQWRVTSTVTPTKTDTYSPTSTDVMTGKAVAQAISGIGVPTKTSELTNDSGFITQNIKVLTSLDGVTYSNIRTYSLNYDEVILNINDIIYRLYGKSGSYYYFVATYFQTLYYYRISSATPWQSGSRSIPSTSSTYSSTSTSAMTGVAVAEALATIDVPTNVSELNNDAGYITENIKLILDTTGVTFNDITSYVTTYDDIIVEKLGRRYRYYGKVDEQHYYFVTTSDTTLYYIYVSDSNSWGGGTRTVPTISNSYSSSSTSAMSGQAVAQALATISVPTKTSDLINDSGFLVESDLSDVAFSGDYNDLTNQPTIPSPTTVEQVLTSGEEIAKVNGTSLFAPQGGGGQELVRSGARVAIRGKSGSITLGTSSTGTNPLSGGRGEIDTANCSTDYTDTYTVSANSDTITIKKTGVYTIDAGFYFSTGFTTNDLMHGKFCINGSGGAFSEVISRATQAAPYLQLSKSITMQLNAGDVVDIRMYNQTGARGVCNVNGAQYLHITRIDEIISGYDFPVDHGEKAVGASDAGRCVWTKWSSGKAELDYTYPAGGITTKVWTAPIYYGDYVSWSNVFNEVCDGIFIEPPDFVNCDSNNSQFINVIPMSWDKNGIAGIRFLSVGAKTGVGCRLHIRAVGRWK